jgi:hypothetical protein
MGARDFNTTAKGTSAADAFKTAVSLAKHQHGHGGYTGTIAEKYGFEMLHPAVEQGTIIRRLTAKLADAEAQSKELLERLLSEVKEGSPNALARALLWVDDTRVTEKDGPAGCFALGKGEWLFFGIASC